MVSKNFRKIVYKHQTLSNIGSHNQRGSLDQDSKAKIGPQGAVIALYDPIEHAVIYLAAREYGKLVKRGQNGDFIYNPNDFKSQTVLYAEKLPDDISIDKPIKFNSRMESIYEQKVSRKKEEHFNSTKTLNAASTLMDFGDIFTDGIVSYTLEPSKDPRTDQGNEKPDLYDIYLTLPINFQNALLTHTQADPYAHSFMSDINRSKHLLFEKKSASEARELIYESWLDQAAQIWRGEDIFQTQPLNVQFEKKVKKIVTAPLEGTISLFAVTLGVSALSLVLGKYPSMGTAIASVILHQILHQVSHGSTHQLTHDITNYIKQNINPDTKYHAGDDMSDFYKAQVLRHIGRAKEQRLSEKFIMGKRLQLLSNELNGMLRHGEKPINMTLRQSALGNIISAPDRSNSCIACAVNTDSAKIIFRRFHNGINQLVIHPEDEGGNKNDIIYSYYDSKLIRDPKQIMSGLDEIEGKLVQIEYDRQGGDRLQQRIKSYEQVSRDDCLTRLKEYLPIDQSGHDIQNLINYIKDGFTGAGDIDPEFNNKYAFLSKGLDYIPKASQDRIKQPEANASDVNEPIYLRIAQLNA